MSAEKSAHGGQEPGAHGDAHGARTSARGTPVPVDVSRDRRARVVWMVLLAGPVVGIGHFFAVYLVAEAGCTGGGPGLRLFDPPVVDALTLGLTAVAAVACLGAAGWAHRRWREGTGAPGRPASFDLDRSGAQDPNRALAFAGFLLSSLFVVTVLAVGLPALFLPGC